MVTWISDFQPIRCTEKCAVNRIKPCKKNNYTAFYVASFEVGVKQSEQATKLSFNTSIYMVKSKNMFDWWHPSLLNTLCGTLGWWDNGLGR